MIALTCGGFTLDSDGNPAAGGVSDDDVVVRENAFLGHHVVDDPEIDLRHHDVAALGEPLRGVAEFNQPKEAAIDRLERDAMIHDREREGAVADGANIGSGSGSAQISS